MTHPRQYGPRCTLTDILESDENGIIPEQDRVITQVVILDADKKQIQCVVRPLQILR
ncbi:phage tail fiber C-terminal domain-containing protein, partial [Escherichia coli]|nr:phage tail fiber C-terminal domain-containing protein [Escherichia coli]